MPGSNERALEKARTLPCDCVIIDLEDAVAPEAKSETRLKVVETVQRGGFAHRETVVRINGLDTEWGAEDMALAAASGADAVLVPKVTSAADIALASSLMDRAGAASHVALWVMIEMPLAILNIAAIGASASETRLSAFVVGTNDLAKELLATPTPDRGVFLPSLALTLLAARAHNLSALDGVFNDISDAEGFHAECIQGQQLGFDGKTLIHPSQIEACNAAFTPAQHDVAHARAVIEAFDDPANAGKGVIKVAGKMTERLHLAQAQRLVAIDEAIAIRGKAD